MFVHTSKSMSIQNRQVLSGCRDDDTGLNTDLKGLASACAAIPGIKGISSRRHIEMCIEMRKEMCTEMCRHVCTRMGSARTARCVHRHV